MRAYVIAECRLRPAALTAPTLEFPFCFALHRAVRVLGAPADGLFRGGGNLRSWNEVTLFRRAGSFARTAFVDGAIAVIVETVPLRAIRQTGEVVCAVAFIVRRRQADACDRPGTTAVDRAPIGIQLGGRVVEYLVRIFNGRKRCIEFERRRRCYISKPRVANRLIVEALVLTTSNRSNTNCDDHRERRCR